MAKKKIRITVDFSEKDYKTLEEMENDCSKACTLRRALSLFNLLVRKELNGEQIRLVHPDGTVERLNILRSWRR